MRALSAAVICLSGLLTTTTTSLAAEGTAKPSPASPLKLRAAHIYGAEHPWQRSFEKFREVVVAQSHGTMDVDIFPNGTFGGEKDYVSLLRQGALDLTTVSANGLEDLAPQITFLDLLFLWKDRDHWQRAFDGEVGTRMTELVNAATSKGGAPRFEVLGWWGGSEVHMLSSKRGYETVKDLAGMKLRIQNSPLQVELWKALDANPLPLPFEQTKEAIKDGTVDAVPLTNSTIQSLKYYEVAPHLSQMSISFVARTMLMSGHTWNKLTAEQREVVRQGAKAATAFDRQIEAEISDRAIEQMVMENGIKVSAFKERALMRERLGAVQHRYAEKLGLTDLLDSIDREWQKP